MLKDILEKFDEKFSKPFTFISNDEIKDFIKASFIELLGEVKLEKKTRKWSEDKINAGGDRKKSYGKREGFNQAVSDLEALKSKLLV